MGMICSNPGSETHEVSELVTWDGLLHWANLPAYLFATRRLNQSSQPNLLELPHLFRLQGVRNLIF